MIQMYFGLWDQSKVMLSVLVTWKAFINELLAMDKILHVDYDLPQEPFNLSLSALWSLVFTLSL